MSASNDFTNITNIGWTKLTCNSIPTKIDSSSPIAERQGKTQEKLRKFTQRKQGWYFGEGEPPNEETASTCLGFLHFISDLNPPHNLKTNAFCEIGGGIELCFYLGNKYIEITVENDGSLFYAREINGETVYEQESPELTQEGIRQLLSEDLLPEFYYSQLWRTRNFAGWSSFPNTGTTTRGELNQLYFKQVDQPGRNAFQPCLNLAGKSTKQDSSGTYVYITPQTSRSQRFTWSFTENRLKESTETNRHQLQETIRSR